MKQISDELYYNLKVLGIITDDCDDTRNYNVGKSDYSKHIIQPWSVWIDYNLNPWDADIIKRVLRNKKDTPRTEEYDKIIHICRERIRQLDAIKERNNAKTTNDIIEQIVLDELNKDGNSKS